MPSLHTPRPDIFCVGIALALIFVLILPLALARTMLGAWQARVAKLLIVFSGCATA